jgi:catechol 2,3-dioxygenase-like lactoylglutathione lyase family enzyme
MKTHLNLATADLAGSVEFYSILLDAKPAKLLDDYALFVTSEPGLELALDRRDGPLPSGDAHYGILVESTSDVDRAAARLERAGLATSIEREETCCYAKQTKVWATDPDRRRWEIYTVLEETVECAGDSCCKKD